MLHNVKLVVYMNLVNEAFVSLLGNPLKRSSSLSGGWPFFGSTTTTKKGKLVTTESSLKISAFFCGLVTISNSIALLPKHVMQEQDDEINRLKNHPVDFLIHNEPNSRMTAFSFWFSYVVSMLLRGDGYARIIRDGNGIITGLELWDWHDVEVLENDSETFYKHKDFKQLFFAWEVFHVPNFTLNGLTGRSIIRYAADNMGVSLAADEFAGSSYENKGISYGVIEVPAGIDLTKKGKENLKKIVEKNLDTGDKNRVSVLDEGMQYKGISLTPAEAAFIEAKAQGVEDIARWLNIPLHKLHRPGEGGYNFLVQMSLEYLQSAVLPLGQKIKEEIQRKMLTRPEKIAGRYIFMNYRKLLEVDPKSRAQYYKDMVYIKAMNPNEVRKFEDMNPYEGGEEFLQMTNLQTKEEIKKKLDEL